MAADAVPALAAQTDSYFLKTKAIVGRFGDPIHRCEGPAAVQGLPRGADQFAF